MPDKSRCAPLEILHLPRVPYFPDKRVAMNDELKTWLGALAVRVTAAVIMGALPAFGIALAMGADPWGPWLIAAWVHLLMARGTHA